MLSLYFRSHVLQLLLVFLNLPGRPLAIEGLVIHYQLCWGDAGTCCAVPHCFTLRTVLYWTDSLPQGNLSWPVTMEEPRGGTYLVPVVTSRHILVFILRWSNILSFKHPVEKSVRSVNTSIWVSLSQWEAWAVCHALIQACLPLLPSELQCQKELKVLKLSFLSR